MLLVLNKKLVNNTLRESLKIQHTIILLISQFVQLRKIPIIPLSPRLIDIPKSKNPFWPTFGQGGTDESYQSSPVQPGWGSYFCTTPSPLPLLWCNLGAITINLPILWGVQFRFSFFYQQGRAKVRLGPRSDKTFPGSQSASKRPTHELKSEPTPTPTSYVEGGTRPPKLHYYTRSASTTLITPWKHLRRGLLPLS